MATRAPRKSRTDKPAAAPVEQAAHDPLREAAQLPATREIIRWEVLAGVFIVVWLLVVGLMAPGFRNEFDFYMARRHQAHQQHAKVLPYLERLYKQMPDNPTVTGELGYAYLQLGQYDKAIEFCKIAQANVGNVKPDDQGRMPEVADFHGEIGVAYFRKNDLENAEKYFQLALEKDKQDKAANFHMGEILMKRGDYRLAADHFKVVATDPGFAESVRKYYAEIEAKLFANVL